MNLDTSVPRKVAKIRPEWEDFSLEERGECIEDSQIPHGMVSSGVMQAGARVPKLPVLGDPAVHLMEISGAMFQEGDILVVAYPDSGGAQLVELLPWLLHQNESPPEDHSNCKLLEHMNRSEIEAAPTPRIFLTHLWAAHFPLNIIHKSLKIVHIVRNPKDVATSMYHRLRRQGVFSFQQFLDLYLTNQIDTGHQIAFLRQMREFQQLQKCQPVLELHYEDMVKKPVEVMQTLGTFFNAPVCGSLCDHILSSNDFLHTLGQTDQSDHSCDGEHRHIPGAVGDWKNTFNMMQNETFNFFLFQTLRDLDINFSYQ